MIYGKDMQTQLLLNPLLLSYLWLNINIFRLLLILINMYLLKPPTLKYMS